MSDSVPLCEPDFIRVSGELGLDCGKPWSFFEIRNPLTLANWTLPVVESLMVIGAVLALVLAVRRLLRNGDPTTLTVWIAALVHVAVFEAVLTVPATFDVADGARTVFAHNVFTVEMAYDRLPLYISAMYPALVVLSFDIVRAIGVFERRGALLGAVCVGFTTMCFYEVFDHLGPQLQWWAWNTVNPVNVPMVASVPMSAVVIFAMLPATAITLLAYALVGGPVGEGDRFRMRAIVWRTAAVAVATLAVTATLGLLTSALAGSATGSAIVLAAVILAFGAAAVPVMFQQWRRTRHLGSEYPSSYARGYGVLYLTVFATLWIYAMPELAGAIGGLTSTGTPIGNFPTVAVCFTFAVGCVAGAWSVWPRTTISAAARTPEAAASGECHPAD